MAHGRSTLRTHSALPALLNTLISGLLIGLAETQGFEPWIPG